MALTAGDLVDRAAATLNDPEHAQWTEAELLDYLSDAQRLIVQIRPQANPVNVRLPLKNGPRQNLPDDAFVLLDVYHNDYRPYTIVGGAFVVTAATDPVLKSISKVARAALDQQNTDWFNVKVKLSRGRGIINFVYEPDNRKTFWVSPFFNDLPDPAPTTLPDGWPCVQLAYARTPAELAAVGDALELDDIYQPALLAYMFYRAHMKDISAEGQGMAKANAYLEQVLTYILGRRQTNVSLFPTAELEKAIA